jgi:PncC family amidohydrolase
MSRDFPRVARLVGVRIEDAVAFCRQASLPPEHGNAGDVPAPVGGHRGDGNPVIAWEVFPEVHVKCPDRAALEAVLARFGDCVYDIDGRTFEAVVVASLAAAGRTLATAESCTGGLIAALVTEVPGSSAVFRGGVVAYANDVKERVLSVPGDVLLTHGAVSGPTVEAMARGVRALTGADLAVAVSGVAGPGGGTPEKPVGTVFIAWDDGGTVESRAYCFQGGRDRVRRAAAFQTLDGIRRRCL